MTRGGLELWNLRHYLLDSFERRAAKPAQGATQASRRQPRTMGLSLLEKQMYDEMARTYNQLKVNLRALRQITSEKLKT